MPNFWTTLPKPFLVLAPMEDVTDIVFREVMTTLPRPDVFFTEFVSADGLCSKGRDATIRKLTFTKKQRPIVAQIWGVNPENMYKAAQTVKELQFDGIDINMGCPDRAVLKIGAGAAHCMNMPLSAEVIQAVREGSNGLPLSVKTRLGNKSVVSDEWIPFLLTQQLSALTVHGRTAAQMSMGEANWDEIGKAVQYRNEISPSTVIIGNGDVKSRTVAQERHKTYGVDGVMVGRGVFANPWVFDRIENAAEHHQDEYIKMLLLHLDLFEKTWGKTKNFDIMKKFFKMYINSFEGAGHLRAHLMECKTAAEIRAVLKHTQDSGGVSSSITSSK